MNPIAFLPLIPLLYIPQGLEAAEKYLMEMPVQTISVPAPAPAAPGAPVAAKAGKAK